MPDAIDTDPPLDDALKVTLPEAPGLKVNELLREIALAPPEVRVIAAAPPPVTAIGLFGMPLRVSAPVL